MNKNNYKVNFEVKMHYLCSVSLVKNESRYLREFYTINKHNGIEVFLFLDRSTEGVPVREIFKGHTDVHVVNYPEISGNRHADGWAVGMNFFQGKSKWTAFIDIDQCLISPIHNDVRTVLQEFESYAAIGVNWHTFGANNREVEPDLSMSTYEAYTRRAVSENPINRHVQSIVQIDRAIIKSWPNPHVPFLKSGEVHVDENKNVFHPPYTTVASQEKLFIPHYYTRSREFWNAKLLRKRADTGSNYDPAATFEHYQSFLNEVEDFTVKNIWESCKGK
jgi:hypothetical protein